MSSDNHAEPITLDKLPREFTRAMPRARAAIFWERAYPRLVPPGVVTALFTSASFAGVWGMASPGQRMAGVAAFAAALALSVLRPPKAFRTESLRVTPREAAQRLDRNTGRPLNVAEIMIDRPVNDSAEETEKFNRHIDSVWKKYAGPFTIGAPKPMMAARDPLRLHIAVAVLAAATALWPQGPRMELLQQAFDWTTPIPAAPPPTPAPALRLKAWVQPPDGIDIRPLEMNETTADKDLNGTVLQAHESSTLTIMTYGQNPRITLNGESLPAQKEISAGPDSKAYQYEVMLPPGRNEIAISGGPSWKIETRTDLPPAATLHGINQKEQRGRRSLDVDYETRDDYGCQGEIVITPSVKPEAGDTPLPSAQIPMIPVPCR